MKCDPARRPKYQRPLVGHRRPHDAASGLCGQPAYPQADRGGLWLDEDRRRPAQDQVSRPSSRVGWAFTFAAAAYNLVRLPKLLEASA